jgi:hypothetical protein
VEFVDGQLSVGKDQISHSPQQNQNVVIVRKSKFLWYNLFEGSQRRTLKPGPLNLGLCFAFSASNVFILFSASPRILEAESRMMPKNARHRSSSQSE